MNDDKTVKCNFHQLTILRQLIIYDFSPKLLINLVENKPSLLLHTILKTENCFANILWLHKIALKKVRQIHISKICNVFRTVSKSDIVKKVCYPLSTNGLFNWFFYMWWFKLDFCSAEHVCGIGSCYTVAHNNKYEAILQCYSLLLSLQHELYMLRFWICENQPNKILKQLT